jgi:hypothetical protein
MGPASTDRDSSSLGESLQARAVGASRIATHPSIDDFWCPANIVVNFPSKHLPPQTHKAVTFYSDFQSEVKIPEKHNNHAQWLTRWRWRENRFIVRKLEFILKKIDQ